MSCLCLQRAAVALSHDKKKDTTRIQYGERRMRMFSIRNLIKTGIFTLIATSLIVCNAYAKTETPEEAALKKGVNLNRQDKYDEAIAEFDNAIKINPISASAYYNLGIIYNKKNDSDKAITNFSKAIEIDTALADAYYNRGSVYYKKGNFDEAISDYNKAIELTPQSADAYYARGLVYSKKNNIDQAIADYNKAIELHPNFALAYDGLAVAYFAKTNYIETLADVNKAQAVGAKPRPLKRTTTNLIENKAIAAGPSGGSSWKVSGQILADKIKAGLPIIIPGLIILLVVGLFKFKKKR